MGSLAVAHIFSFKRFLFYSCVLPACVLCVPHTFLVPTEVKRGHQISWIWSYGWLWANMWVLGVEYRSSARTSSLNHWDIFPAQHIFSCAPPPGADIVFSHSGQEMLRSELQALDILFPLSSNNAVSVARLSKRPWSHLQRWSFHYGKLYNCFEESMSDFFLSFFIWSVYTEA